MEAQRVVDGEARGPELPQVRQETPAREVDTPFARSGSLLERRDGILQIQVAGELAVPLLDGLGQIDGRR